MDIKWNEEYVKEKIEEYLEIYNQSLGIEGNTKTTRENVLTEDESMDSDTLDDDDNNNNNNSNLDENQETKKKKIYYGKKPPKVLVDGEVSIDEVTQNPSMIGVRYEPLDDKKRQPRQEEALKEINAINERISSLVQIRQMGLSTPDNTKQLKQLMADRKRAAFKLRRLQLRQRASNKYRVKQRKIVNRFSSNFVNLFFFSFVC